MEDFKKQVTQILAEAFNIMQISSLPPMTPKESRRALQTQDQFQAIVQSLAEGKIELYEAMVPGEDDKEEDTDAAE